MPYQLPGIFGFRGGGGGGIGYIGEWESTFWETFLGQILGEVANYLGGGSSEPTKKRSWPGIPALCIREEKNLYVHLLVDKVLQTTNHFEQGPEYLLIFCQTPRFQTIPAWIELRIYCVLFQGVCLQEFWGPPVWSAGGQWRHLSPRVPQCKWITVPLKGKQAAQNCLSDVLAQQKISPPGKYKFQDPSPSGNWKFRFQSAE